MTDTTPSFTNKFIIALILIIFLFPIGLIAASVWAKEARQYSNAPGANNLIWLNRIAFWLLLIIVVGILAYLLIGIAAL